MKNFLKNFFVLVTIILFFASFAQKDKFETYIISISYGSVEEGFSFDIADTEIINRIKTICSEGSFNKVPKDDMLEGLCSIFIDFNNGTVIGMYSDMDYGNIEKTKDPLGIPVYLPTGLNKYILELIDDYS